MINIRPLIETRIRTQIPAFKEVAGAVDLASILKGRLSDNGCYIFQESESDDPSNLVGATRQQQFERFAIVTVVRNVRDSRGTDAADLNHIQRVAVKEALLGWQPHAAFDPFEKAGGKIIGFVNGTFIWSDTYKTSQLISSI